MSQRLSGARCLLSHHSSPDSALNTKSAQDSANAVLTVASIFQVVIAKPISATAPAAADAGAQLLARLMLCNE